MTVIDPDKTPVSVTTFDLGDVEETILGTEKAEGVSEILEDPDGVGIVCTAIDAGVTYKRTLDSVEAPVDINDCKLIVVSNSVETTVCKSVIIEDLYLKSNVVYYPKLDVVTDLNVETLATLVDLYKVGATVTTMVSRGAELTISDTEKADISLDIAVNKDGAGFVCHTVNAGEINADMLDFKGAMDLNGNNGTTGLDPSINYLTLEKDVWN